MVLGETIDTDASDKVAILYSVVHSISSIYVIPLLEKYQPGSHNFADKRGLLVKQQVHAAELDWKDLILKEFRCADTRWNQLRGVHSKNQDNTILESLLRTQDQKVEKVKKANCLSFRGILR